MRFGKNQKDFANKSYRVEYRNTKYGSTTWSFYANVVSFDIAKRIADKFTNDLYDTFEVRIVEYIQSFKILETRKGKCAETEDNHGDNTLQAAN